MPLTISNPLSGVTSLVMAGATSAAPVANTIIVDLSTLPSATYYFSVITGQAGTFDGAASNILVNVGGTGSPVVSGGTTYGPLTSFAASATPTPQTFRLRIPTGGARVVICVGNTNGGAGAIYTAGVTVTKLLSTGGFYF